MAPCGIASFTIAREKSIAIGRLQDNEGTQSAEVTEGEASVEGSASDDSGVERAPGCKPNLEWCTYGGPRGTYVSYVEAMQRRGDEANRKKCATGHQTTSEMGIAKWKTEWASTGQSGGVGIAVGIVGSRMRTIAIAACGIDHDREYGTFI